MSPIRMLAGCCLCLVLVPLTGCATQWPHHRAITRYELFTEPQRILISRTQQTMAIEVDAWYVEPDAAYRLRSRGCTDAQREELLAHQPAIRRYLVAPSRDVDALIRDDLDTKRTWGFRADEPHEWVEVAVHPRPLKEKDDRGFSMPRWSVVPAAFDAPSATVGDLPPEFGAGYEVYLGDERVPWTNKQGLHWLLTPRIRDHPSSARYERPFRALDLAAPVCWAFDCMTLPIQIPAIMIMYARSAAHKQPDMCIEVNHINRKGIAS